MRQTNTFQNNKLPKRIVLIQQYQIKASKCLLLTSAYIAFSLVKLKRQYVKKIKKL
jgi:hypothetical protein